jgi:CBS domain-containing protein
MNVAEPRLAAPPEVVDDDPMVVHLMTTPVVAIVPTARLTVALHLLATHGVRHLPVVEEDRCVGMLLDTDIAHLLAYTTAPPAVPPLRVADLCRQAPVVTSRDRRSVAALRMRDMGVDAALVVDGGRLVGIVTSTDVIRSIADAVCPPSTSAAGT